MSAEKIVLITGGFDPVHSGHLAYINSARALGDLLIIGVNSDAWLARKKGRSFMPLSERMSVLQHLQGVDHVITFDDSDGSARGAIARVRQDWPNSPIIFANGGDRTSENIPEMDVRDSNLEFVFGVGGEDKKNSSSWILEEWKAPKTLRPWGYYRVLHEVPGTKVKELTIEPGASLSRQRHQHRSEYWFVSAGSCQVELEDSSKILYQHDDMVKIPAGAWHRLGNPFSEPCKIVEIQFGSICVEEDIERHS